MNETMPIVTIIIPVYNGANFLSQAIDSALAQVYPNIEILVINDGSNDKHATRAVAERYGKRIRYFEKPNGGVASALNFGIKRMRGEYFSWLSHDDFYTPDKIEKQIAFYRFRHSDSLAVVYSDFDVVDESNVLKGAYRINKSCVGNSLIPVMFGFINGCTMLIPAVCFDRVGLFDEKLRTTQDYELWFRMAKIFTFVHVPVTAVKCREHSAQTSIVDSNHNYESDILYVGFIDKLTDKEIRQLGGAKFITKLYLLLVSRGFKYAACHLQQRTGYIPSPFMVFFFGRICTGWSNHFNCWSLFFNPIYFLRKALIKAKILCQIKQSA